MITETSMLPLEAKFETVSEWLHQITGNSFELFPPRAFSVDAPSIAHGTWLDFDVHVDVNAADVPAEIVMGLRAMAARILATAAEVEADWQQDRAQVEADVAELTKTGGRIEYAGRHAVREGGAR